jgi:cold shock protein
MTGTVKWFNDSKGYGFLVRTTPASETPQDIFVHYTEIQGEGFKTLTEGQQVEYDQYESPKGPIAKNVRKLT